MTGKLHVKLLMHLSELLIGDVGVNLCRSYIFMSEEFLYRAEISTISEEGSGKGVSYGMSRNGFDDACLESPIGYHFRDEETVKTYFVRSSINREVLSVLEKKRREVVLSFFQIRPNRLTSPFREVDNTDFATFTEDSEFHCVQIHIFYIQRSELGDAQTSTKNGENNGSITEIDNILGTN